MKKLVYLGALALAASMAACSGSASHKGEAGFDSLYSAKDADSLLTAFGQVEGASLNNDFERFAMQDTSANIPELKKLFVEGMQYAFAADTADLYLAGLGYGLQWKGRLKQFEGMGVKGDPKAFVEGLRKVLLDPAYNPAVTDSLQQQLQYQQRKFEALKARYDSLELEHSEASVANLEAGNAKLDELKAQGYTLDGSGIAYKIDNPGEGDKLKADDKVLVAYTMKRLNGSTVRTATPDYPVSVENIGTQGLSIGLQKLGKGGKATIYVPGRLAYGVGGQRAGFGPNEMVVYEVEVVDVNPTGN